MTGLIYPENFKFRQQRKYRDIATRKGKMATIVLMVVLQLLIGSRELFAFKKISPEKLNWTDAKDFCADQNSMLIDPDTTTNIEKYWTGAYYAPSHWIHIIGCFEDSSVKAVRNRSSVMNNKPNIGLCQLKCYPLEAFAVKSNECLCLNNLPPKEGSSSSKNCPIQCNDTNKDVYLQDCGGVSHYNVYRTTRTTEKYKRECQAIKCAHESETFKSAVCERGLKKTCTTINASYRGNPETTGWKNSLQFCKDNEAYLMGNISINNVSAACKVINNMRSDLTWIGIRRQPVLVSGEDDFEGIIEENVLQCQRCSKGGCEFTDCNKEALAVCKQNSEVVSMTEDSTQTATESYTESERSDLNSTNITSKNSEVVSMTKDSVQTATESYEESERSDLNSTNITSKQSGADKRGIIITVSTITILLLILSLSVFCFVRKNIRKKSHEALKPTRFNNKIYQQQGDDEASGTEDDTAQDMQTDHYTYVETCDAVPKAEYSEIGVYSHLRENEEKRDQTGDLDVYNHLKDTEEGREQGGGTYDCASGKKAAASDHRNSDHIYDQSSADVYGEKETESGLEGDEYHHTGLILTENTYDETKMSTAGQDLDGEYSHTQDLQTEHAYGKVDVQSGALDDEYSHTIDIETEQALQNYKHSQEVQIKKREA